MLDALGEFPLGCLDAAVVVGDGTVLLGAEAVLQAAPAAVPDALTSDDEDGDRRDDDHEGDHDGGHDGGHGCLLRLLTRWLLCFIAVNSCRLVER